MPAVFEYNHVVAPEEIDVLGHASNVAYFNWMQAAALAHSAAQGWPGEAYQRLGLGWVVRSHQITYQRPAMPGDTLLIRTWVANFHRVTSLRRYDILRQADGKPLAAAATDWAFINYNTRLPTRVPPEVIAAFELVDNPHDPFLPSATRGRPSETRAAPTE